MSEKKKQRGTVQIEGRGPRRGERRRRMAFEDDENEGTEWITKVTKVASLRLRK